jgi:hypothetical protein
MATLLLQAAGAALGGVFGPLGSVVGRAAGALAGSAIDRMLIGGNAIEGPRLAGGRVPTSEEGAGIVRLYGTARIAGNLIWATRFEEDATSERRGGKGGGGTRVETFSYHANFAVGLCEGPIAGIRRIWADGREIDQSLFAIRLHRGAPDQLPDPLIEARQGAGMTPAYRGLAYVVFERFALEDFGNRIPVLHFEVTRPVGRLERELTAITIIPGATEHGYSPMPVSEATGPGETRIMNRHVSFAPSDWTASLDMLQALCPKLKTVALVTTWFGDDLRAGNCRIRPGVEEQERREESVPWTVSGETRGSAHPISRIDGTPAFGGTPNDRSVLDAIADLKARGLRVFLYPFIMMDVPPGNALADPQGDDEQPAYPWRGRITSDPAPGVEGSADRTAAARAQIDAFCGTAGPGDFMVGPGTVTSDADFRYRRFVLHHAHLAALAGGVDGFVLGSEMRGLTRVRDDEGRFPFVDALESLAADVRAILGPQAGLTYAADWSEYFGYRPDDGSGDVFYNLDPLWMHPAISAVGIDNYMPLADWRDEDFEAGNPDGFKTPSDIAALRSQITSGEGFDWYYADETGRRSRIRTPITDGAAGKPWVFRFKDLESWWSNPHHERLAGVEIEAATVWTPGAKPIWFTELGCPAIDKGANQPNVFPDPKSSEGQVPHFSDGTRSDLIQRRFLEAHLDHWTGPGAPSGMVDPEMIFAWSWDSRPHPAFPSNRGVWSDGDNWSTGHWLTGRLGTLTASDLVAAICADHGFADHRIEELGGDMVGYVQTGPAPARAVIEPVLDLVQASAAESGGFLRFFSRTRRVVQAQPVAVLADIEGEPVCEEARGHVAEWAREAMFDHFDPITDYEPATARSRRLETPGEAQRRLSLPLTMEEPAATGEIDLWLRDHWAARDTVRFALPPNRIEIEPGDVLSLPAHDVGRVMVRRIEDTLERRLDARAMAGLPAGSARSVGRVVSEQPASASGWSPQILFIDLPVLEGDREREWFRAAAFSRPWRRVALQSSPDGESFETRVTLDAPAVTGLLTMPLAPGRAAGRFTLADAMECLIHFDGLSSRVDHALLNGANALALRAANGAWEIVQFARAEEIAPKIWRLSRLLRGQGGTEDAMAAGAPAGSDLVLIDSTVRPIPLRNAEAGLALRWHAASTVGTMPVAGTVTGGLRALTPLAPVHLKADRRPDGAIALSWIRRGRLDADDWLAPDIPLDAPAERYRVEIGTAAGATVRSIDVDEPAYLYSTAGQAEDFGAPVSSMSLRVRQHGARVPLGLPATRGFSF